MQMKRRLLFSSLLLFVLAFLIGATLFYAPVVAETEYAYEYSEEDTFTLSDVVVLTHEKNGTRYAMKNNGEGAVVPQTVEEENGVLTTDIPDSLLWQVEQGEQTDQVKFRSLADGNYLRVETNNVAVSTENGSSFVNQRLLYQGSEYIYFNATAGEYGTKDMPSRGITVDVYKRTEKQSAAAAVIFYDGQGVYATKELSTGQNSFTIASLSVLAPEKDGYTFVGWEKDGEIVSCEQEIAVLDKVELYARYTVGNAYRASVSLKGDIALHVYMRFDEQTAKQTNAYVRIFANGNTENVLLSQAEQVELDEKTYHKFSCSLSAKDYDQTVELTVYTNGEEGTKVCYSVREYAEKLLGLPNEEYVAVKPLVQAMLSYCKAAKGYFYNGTVEEIEDVALSDLQPYQVATDGSLEDGVTFLGATLTLETTTALRIYFSANDVPVCRVNGKEVRAMADEKVAGQYYLEIKNVSAKDLDETQTFEIGGFTIRCSALSYAYAVLGGEYDESLKNVVKALYLYNAAANEYFQGAN